MWELIAANKRKSVVLITVMGMLMIGVGMLIAEAAAPGGWLAGGGIAPSETAQHRAEDQTHAKKNGVLIVRPP